MGVSLQVIAAAILLGWSVGVATADGINADAREITPSERARTERQRGHRLRVMREADTNAIAWGNERHPNSTVVFTLDEPLEKTTGSDAVEVELFSPGFDDDGTAYITSCATTLALGSWWPTLEEAHLPVHLTYRQVDEGPGLDDRHRQSRQSIAELIIGGSIYGRKGNDGAERLIADTMDWLRNGGTSEDVLDTNITDILRSTGVEPAEREQDIRNKIERTRSTNNERWFGFAGQYVRWRGHDPSGRRALGQGAAPIVLVDGRYLVTMNTIRRQGGRRATERLFQTVNGLIAKQIESRKNQTGERGTTMNYTAAVLMGSAIVLGGCGPTQVAESGIGASDANTERSGFLSPRGWKEEIGSVEILPSGAHVRLKSGKVVQVLFLTPLEGQDGREAQAFLSRVTEGRTVSCGWPAEAADRGDPRAVTEDGFPIASCRIRKQAFAKCASLPCRMGYQAISNGYGRLLLGPWQNATPSTARRVENLKEAEREARHARTGLWERWEG